ncbi:MAG: cation acetate symporter, partial [Sinomonas sp.]|nr:cation acetate symporter [Sinomonas sp.]
MNGASTESTLPPALAAAAVIGVAVATVLVGIHGLRISRTTSDFYVASRTVRPWWNASAIGGEYLSAASFLGVAGLIMVNGFHALWYPVGYTAGFLMLLLFVAAPLRRSGAYTIPDFAAARLGSVPARRVTSILVVLIAWLYIVPQLQGAALAVGITTGLPGWVGSVAVVAVVVASVMFGGMRSITFVQAFQFWLKLAALALPAAFLALWIAGRGAPSGGLGSAGTLAVPESLTAPDGVYRTASIMVALLFGTLGLPHVLVRFYANPDGPSA